MLPVCAWPADFGATMPPVVQDVRPDSKPPLATVTTAGALGVTNAEIVAGEVPMALVAVTLKV